MVIIIRCFLVCCTLLISSYSWAHLIYAPNDIPMLDNRFRIDPYTEEVTFILNHSKRASKVVLVRPDGSKLYSQRHPENVAWVSTKQQDIITIKKPMGGPWQAIAKLDGNNRIKLMTKVQLKTSKLPLKLYAQEYITTHASLYYDNKIMNNPSYIKDAQLSVSFMGEASKLLALYSDDGKHYDSLAFDGDLTTHIFIDLLPGRYLLNIYTQNDIFIRNVNKDVVVFTRPISYTINPQKIGSDIATFKFTIDSTEIDPESVSIDGIIKDEDGEFVTQLLAHGKNNISDHFYLIYPKQLKHELYTFSGKAFATTRSGREVELQLEDQLFQLIPPFIMPEPEIVEVLATDEMIIAEEPIPSSLFSNIWVVIALVVTLLSVIGLLIFLFLWRKKKKKAADNNLDISKLTLDGLEPTSMDVKK